jgi:hypothetical protein
MVVYVALMQQHTTHFNRVSISLHQRRGTRNLYGGILELAGDTCS